MKKPTAKVVKKPAKTAKPVAKTIPRKPAPRKPAPRKATAAKEPANRDSLAAAVAGLAAIAAELREVVGELRDFMAEGQATRPEEVEAVIITEVENPEDFEEES